MVGSSITIPQKTQGSNDIHLYQVIHVHGDLTNRNGYSAL